LNAARPSHVPGSRIDPPMSVPTLRGAYPAAAAAPAPDDDPPVVSAGSQGLRLMPCRLETPDESIPQSGMTVDPTITAPASVSRSTTGELRSGRTGTTPALPAGMGTPARARFSLTVAGTPSSGPRASPRRQRSVLSAAATLADSSARSHRALSSGSASSTTSRAASTTSVGERLPSA